MITNRGAALLLAGTLVAVGIAADHALPTKPSCEIVTYEDGSGVRYCGDQESGTWPEGTFAWDCETMGNRICGPPR